MASRRLRREDYTVGWVSALPIEFAAAQEMLDEEHEDLHHDASDTNIYTLGRIGGHNVVIACLPVGQTGTNSVAAVAAQIKSAFTSIRFGLCQQGRRTRLAMDFSTGLACVSHASDVLGMWVMITSALLWTETERWREEQRLSSSGVFIGGFLGRLGMTLQIKQGS
jgi:hypothetical protein